MAESDGATTKTSDGSVWHLLLSSWQIQDGWPGELTIGCRLRCSVEFGLDSDLMYMAVGPLQSPMALHLGDGRYRVTSQVMDYHAGLLLLDIGIPVSRTIRRSRHFSVGEWLTGEAVLGVDPYHAPTRHAPDPTKGPVFIDWQVDGILMQVARPADMVPGDRRAASTPSAWQRLLRTNSWEDDGGNAEYLLECRRVG